MLSNFSESINVKTKNWVKFYLHSTPAAHQIKWSLNKYTKAFLWLTPVTANAESLDGVQASGILESFPKLCLFFFCGSHPTVHGGYSVLEIEPRTQHAKHAFLPTEFPSRPTDSDVQ